MGSNKFNRALGHLKSTSIDERIRQLDEQPTNNTSQIYIDQPDSTTTTELNPNLNPVDLTVGDTNATKRDTSGLFMPDGTILTEEPPGDTSYILGPMAAMYYTWSYPWTMIGYIRQSDRKMVNLGRIDGKLSDWNGTAGNATSGSGTFNSYGQLTLEQAVWFRDIKKQSGASNDPSTYNYYAFYPGPPSQTPDAFGRYPCVITGVPKRRTETISDPATNHATGLDPNWGLPGLPNLSPDERKRRNDRLRDLMGRDPSTLTDTERQELMDAGLDDFVKGGDTQSPLGNLALLGLTFAGVKAAAAAGLGLLGKALGLTGAATQVAPLIGSADSASDYNKQLAMKLPSSILSGTPAEIKLTPRAAQDQINNLDPAAVERFLTVGGEPPKPSADSTIRPQNKGQILTGDWGTQGGSEIHYDPKTDTITITSEKTLRTTSGGNTVQTDSTGRIISFSDIPTPPPEKVDQISKDLLNNPIIDAALGGLGNVYNAVVGQRGDFQPAAIGPNPWDMIKNDPAAKAEFTKQLSQQGTSLATGAVQGTASNAVALRQALTNLGVPPSEIERNGGAFGQVYSQTSYSGDQIPAEIRGAINNRVRKVESVNYNHKRKRILREIKNDVIIPEEKKEKLKGYRPKFKGALNEYDKLMQKAENPASFKQMDETTWTKQDKYFNARLSQERKNEVLDHLGTGDHFWEILTETGRKRGEKGLKEKYGDFTLVRKEQLVGDTLLFLVDENGKKETILQSEYSDRIARQNEEHLWEQETLNAPNDPLMKRVRSKLANQIDYPDKPSRMGYPDGPTPQQVAGWHPEYGKRAAYYNGLDPQSADAMPATGDPETDQKVAAQKTPLKPVKQVYRKKGKPNS